MSTPISRAAGVRGTLVAACSAVVTVAAHGAGGGGMPHSGGLILVLLMCATAGAAVSVMTLEGHHSRPVGIVLALCVAQFLGHIMLVVAGGHHHVSSYFGLTSSMVVAHAAAAVVLGAAITSVEHLFRVCASVLCWLRLFSIAALRPVSCAVVLRTASVPVVQSVLLNTGLGMRAPPQGTALPA